jgi:malate dehydrogenase (oxaloacetate-decarboxylating)(NADP+)
MSIQRDALEYHALPTPGKISVVPTKSCETARDLSLAYSPGVAAPCLEIERDPQKVYEYTAKGNLVAVISNGTAVLGLGDIGPAAGKPVMEGKGVLFKTFADIDVFDLELDCKDPVKFVEAVATLGPTFGGINLEDIKAPECFYIERELQKRLDIPVFHDDQHGTAIIAGAALLNALELAHKKIEEVRLVVSGAGASAIACTNLMIRLGLKRENILMVDTTGVIYEGRKEGMNEFKAAFAVNTEARTLTDAMTGADVFLGLSAKGLVTPEMLKLMAKNPIVFAMANPDPEIDYPSAVAARSDIIMATGRSDFPNQVNNVLGFPYIFRGALDVRAKAINEEMKLAAVYALAKLAKEPVPESVRKAYGNAAFTFGPEYIIPKPFDPRALYYVAPAVAQAAIDTGMARLPLSIEEYTRKLKAKQNQGREVLSGYYAEAQRSKRKRVGFPEGVHPRVMRAAAMARDEGIAEPILFGPVSEIRYIASAHDISLDGMEIVDPATDARYEKLVTHYYQTNARRGVTRSDAERELRRAHAYANTLLALGEIDALICGVDRYFPTMVKPLLETIGLAPGVTTAAALYIVTIRGRTLFFADTAINTSMSREKLAEIAVMAGEFAQTLDVHPRIALLSYSNFGSVKRSTSELVRDAAALARDIAAQRGFAFEIDGEMQADTAVVDELIQTEYPMSYLKGAANVLVFPDMQSGNISYKLLQRLGGARVIGPVILGLQAPAYVMQRHAGVDEIFNMITVAAAQASLRSKQVVSLAVERGRVGNL